jgi:hypothetical protein
MTIEPGKTYKNKKTGKAYRVLHIAFSADDPDKRLVVYRHVSKDCNPVWVRGYEEFLEKFTEVSDDGV